MKSTTPINRMPPEILWCIFLLILPSELPYLRLVCKTWRDVVHQMSHLWTILEIKPHMKFSVLEVLELASMRASRTGSLPLNVLWDPALKDHELTNEVKMALSTFFKNAPTARWATAFIRNTSGFSDDTLDLVFSSLTIFGIGLTMDEPNLRLLKSVDETATSMKELCVNNNWVKLAPLMPKLIGRIGALHLNDTSAALRLELPENVVLLRLRVLVNSLDGLTHVPRITVYRVDLLSLISNTLPALVHLDIRHAPYHHNIDIDLHFPSLLLLRIPFNAPFLLECIIAPKLEQLQLLPKQESLREEGDEELTDELWRRYRVLIDSGDFPSNISLLFLPQEFNIVPVLLVLGGSPKLAALNLTINSRAEIKWFLRILHSDALQGYRHDPREVNWQDVLCPRLVAMSIRYKGHKEEEIEADLEMICSNLLTFRRSAGLKFIRLAWEDGSESRWNVRDVTELEETN